MSVRWLLPSATTFYVATNGNDANDGLSAATAFATFARAMSVITGQIDFGGQAVTLQGVAGHATFTEQINISPWVGGGSFTLDLGGGSNTTTGADAVSLIGQPPGVPTVQNGTLSTVTSGNCLHQQSAGVVQFQTLTFGACAGNHIYVNGGGGRLNCIGNYSITGGANRHIQVNPTNAISIEGTVVPSLTVTLTGTPVFSTFFAAATGGDLFIDQVTFSGSATTPTNNRYFINNNGVIFTGGGGETYLPGSGSGSPRGGVINQPGFYL